MLRTCHQPPPPTSPTPYLIKTAFLRFGQGYFAVTGGRVLSTPCKKKEEKKKTPARDTRARGEAGGDLRVGGWDMGGRGGTFLTASTQRRYPSSSWGAASTPPPLFSTSAKSSCKWKKEKRGEKKQNSPLPPPRPPATLHWIVRSFCNSNVLLKNTAHDEHRLSNYQPQNLDYCFFLLLNL